MNKRFTKLEIILIGIILIFVIGFFGTKNFNLFVSKENLLRQRFNKFLSLQNDKNYSESYTFLSSSVKDKPSLEEYTKSLSNISSQKVIINKIIIKDNIAYIDRNNVILENGIYKTLRGYKKWVFENGNWYLSNPGPWCLREEMYEMPPEFKRALSLIDQRFTVWFKSSGLVSPFRENNPDNPSFFDCLNIQYSDTAGAEGLFTFDENSSDIENLHIYVNRSYVNSDDLLTAFLLMHETTHAFNYLQKVINGTSITCIDDEVNAFNLQLLFTGVINSGERESLNTRLRQGYQNLNNPLKINSDLITLRDQAQRICKTNTFDSCTMNAVVPLIEKMVRSNPYYQKQCNL